MSTSTSQFDYNLPSDRIAQHSVEPRDHSKLMILNRQTGEIQHKYFYDLINELHSGDVLVFNDTKVFKARLKILNDKIDEIFLLRCVDVVGAGLALPAALPAGRQVSAHSKWQALIRPAKKIQVGDIIKIKNVEIVVREKQDDGVVILEFPMDETEALSFTDLYGSIPIPPYVSEVPDDTEKYQTVYAREVGSVAAPTAGFHFTNDLLNRLKQKGIEIAFVTLHVGIGTFRPMQSETIEEHIMHCEFVQIPVETAEIINRAKKEKRRVIAVGTTTVRSLEGVALICYLNKKNEKFVSYRASDCQFSRDIPPFVGMTEKQRILPESGFVGDVNLFITPGFDFKIIDGLITNFHLPKSTLLVLVSTFAGRENVLRAYDEAIKNDYRFFSFGDAMFIR